MTSNRNSVDARSRNLWQEPVSKSENLWQGKEIMVRTAATTVRFVELKQL
jgi:hypothetical protein